MTLLAIATNTAGPSFQIHGWFAWLFLAGLGAGAVVALKQLFWPVLRSSVHVAEAVPAMQELAKMAPIITAMAQQFETNGGTSMRALLERTDAKVDALQGVGARLEARVGALEAAAAATKGELKEWNESSPREPATQPATK